MVSTDTQITAGFVVLGVLLWYGTTHTTDSTVIQFAVLLGIGLVAPTVVNEWRRRSA